MKTGSSSALFSLYPAVNNIGFSTIVSSSFGKTNLSAGISERYRSFISNNYTLNTVDGAETRNNLSSLRLQSFAIFL